MASAPQNLRDTTVHDEVSPLGAAPPPTKSCLVQIHPLDLGRGMIHLPAEAIMIGRDPICGIVVADTGVSRRHALLEPSKGGFIIVDQGSTNGTFVNEVRIERAVMTDGDLIRVGGHVLKFLHSDHIEARYHETMYSMMVTDGLTGAYNRRYLIDAMERELARARRRGRPISLVMLDLDHFKKINDNHGHPTGDIVLREAARRIRESIRRDEIFARYGGEEFAILMPDATAEEAEVLAKRLWRLIGDEPFIADAITLNVTASVGVGVSLNGQIEVAELIQLADRPLYRAKQAGRNQVLVEQTPTGAEFSPPLSYEEEPTPEPI